MKWHLRESHLDCAHRSGRIRLFDLSPEKLQLVQELWGDLASTPEAVPVHEWQKQELARRKANLQKHPAAVKSWEEVKSRVRGGDGG